MHKDIQKRAGSVWRVGIDYQSAGRHDFPTEAEACAFVAKAVAVNEVPQVYVEAIVDGEATVTVCRDDAEADQQIERMSQESHLCDKCGALMRATKLRRAQQAVSAEPTAGETLCVPCQKQEERKNTHCWSIRCRESDESPWERVNGREWEGLTEEQLRQAIFDETRDLSFPTGHSFKRGRYLLEPPTFSSHCSFDGKEYAAVSKKTNPRRYIPIVMDHSDKRNGDPDVCYVQVWLPDTQKKGSKPAWRTIRTTIGMEFVEDHKGRTERIVVYNKPVSVDEAVGTMVLLKARDVLARLVDGKGDQLLNAILTTAPKENEDARP